MQPSRATPPTALLADLRDIRLREVRPTASGRPYPHLRRTGPGDIAADLEVQQTQVLERHALRPLAGGLQNQVYAWEDPVAGPTCLKIYVKGNDRRRVDREWAALTLLAEHRIGGVPRPLWLDHHNDVPAIGMTLLTGSPLPDSADRAAALLGVARAMRGLRGVPLSGLLADLERIDSGTHYMQRLTGSWPELLTGHHDDALAADMLALLATWRDSNDAALVHDNASPVFSRGDSNLLNWLCDGAATACVDFEYSGHGSAVFDAADLVEHISARAVPDAIWIELLPELGVTSANRRHFLAAQRTCALRWLAALWKQRHTRAAEFAAQHHRVRLLQNPNNPWRD